MGVGGWSEKKMSAWRVLKSPCPQIYAWGEGGLACLRLSKMKYGFENSIFKCQSWPVSAKQPIND